MKNKFLETYRNLETELNYDNQSVLDYENNLSGTEQEKLKVCRIMRNYFVHNDMSFLIPTSAQIKFLNDLIINIRRQSNTVKDEMKRVTLIKSNLSIKTVMTKFKSNDYIPMQVKNGLYIIDKDILIKNLIANNKKIIVPKRLPKYNYTTKDTRIEFLANGFYIITEDGTKDGKYLGLLDLKRT